MSGDMPDRMIERTPERRSQGILAKRMSNDMSAIRKNVRENVRKECRKDMLERMSEDMSERMSEETSERMPERMSEDMSERMSDRTQWSRPDPDQDKGRGGEDNLMKFRGRRALDFIRVFLSSSSSSDFTTKNVRICQNIVPICCNNMMSRWGSLEVKQLSPAVNPSSWGTRCSQITNTFILAI